MPRPTTRKDHDARASRAGNSLSKHDLLAQALRAQIEGGKLQVGDLLPSEPQLSERFGVSRHTVRAALQTLQRLGLVASQQGVGTRVQAVRPVSRYSPSFNSAQDLLQYATTTPVRVIDRAQVTVNPAMAAQFGCKAGEHWWRVRTLRLDPTGQSVVAYSEIHIPLAFGAVLDESPRSREPIFALIEQRFGETIMQITQDITCLRKLTPAECAHLQVPRGSPGLEITRHYLGRQGRVLEVARSVHPAEVFKYSMRMQLHHATTP